MTGVETRTSSPLRMGRDENRVSTTVGGFYPMGEGAGYAGGIMSACLGWCRNGDCVHEHVCKT